MNAITYRVNDLGQVVSVGVFERVSDGEGLSCAC